MHRWLLINGSLMEGVGDAIRRQSDVRIHQLTTPGVPLRKKNTRRFRKHVRKNDYQYVFIQPNRYEMVQRWWDGRSNDVARDLMHIVKHVTQPVVLVRPWLPPTEKKFSEGRIGDNMHCLQLLIEAQLYRPIDVLITNRDCMDKSGHLHMEGADLIARDMLDKYSVARLHGDDDE